MSFCQYSIDENNVIRSIGGNWADFAAQNNGLKSIENDLVGSSLWSHVHGLEVKCYLNAIFFAVRTSQIPLLLPYRCDSPRNKRKFLMSVIPTNDKQLIVEHLGVPMVVDSSNGAPSQPSIVYSSIKCSICCSLKVGNEWLDPLVRPSEEEFPKGQAVCPACKDRAASATSRVIKIAEARRRLGHDR